MLNTGAWMPLLGLGTWKMSTEVAVRLALQVGYRHLDCAAVYDNERMVGNVLKQMVGDGVGQVARRDLFITSKLWNTDHRAQSVRPALLSTLTDLGLEYLGAHHAAGSISPRGLHVYFCMHVYSGEPVLMPMVLPACSVAHTGWSSARAMCICIDQMDRAQGRDAIWGWAC